MTVYIIFITHAEKSLLLEREGKEERDDSFFFLLLSFYTIIVIIISSTTRLEPAALHIIEISSLRNGRTT